MMGLTSAKPEVVYIMAKQDKYAGLSESEIIELKHQQKKKRQAIFDKFTTGLLIFLMSSPILILGYIFIWFVVSLNA